MPFVWAHRGASALAPENTVEAFLLAARLGARGIELDVHLSADGVPVVLHDAALWAEGSTMYLRRPAGADAPRARRLPIAGTKWADVAAAPVTFPDGTIAQLARLEQVLEAVPEGLWVDVELKAGSIYDERLVDVVLGCLRRRPERVLVSSFDHVVLAEVAASEPALPLSALCDARLADPRPMLSPIPASMICVRRAFINASDVERFRADGYEVSVYGHEILLDLPSVLSWSAAAIFLDDPRLALGAAKGPGRQGHG
ncbi:MAG: glycerophosphodiester phosphodiesterase [Acidimicrobiales bacterium]